jgi:hypothetical protein
MCCSDNFVKLEIYYGELKTESVTQSLAYDIGSFFGKDLVDFDLSKTNLIEGVYHNEFCWLCLLAVVLLDSVDASNVKFVAIRSSFIFYVRK